MNPSTTSTFTIKESYGVTPGDSPHRGIPRTTAFTKETRHVVVSDPDQSWQTYEAKAKEGAFQLGDWVVVRGDAVRVFKDEKEARHYVRGLRGPPSDPVVFLQYGAVAECMSWH